jgi:hypothetical protein
MAQPLQYTSKSLHGTIIAKDSLTGEPDGLPAGDLKTRKNRITAKQNLDR